MITNTATHIDRVTITIARQLGSGGSYVGQQIANRLGYKYIDREVLHLAAEQLGVDVAVLAGMEERCSSFWRKMFGVFGMGGPDMSYSPPPLRPMDDKQLFDKQTEIMKILAAECNSVIIGRGAVDVLDHHPGMINLFLHAPVSFRIDRVIELYHAPNRESAREMIEESDKMRKKYFAQMTGRDWACAINYHLSIDTSANSFPVIVDMLVDYIKRRVEE